MNLQYRTNNIQRRSKDLRCSVFDVRCSMFAAYLVLLTGVAFYSNGLAEETSDTEPIKIGLLLPAIDSLDPDDSAAFRGATLAIEEANVLAGFFQKSFQLVIGLVKDEAESDGIARRLIEKEGVSALISNLQVEAFRRACSAAQQSETLLLNCGAKLESLRADSGPFCLHVEAGTSDYVRALGEYLVKEKNYRRFYLIRSEDSGGRELEEKVRKSVSEIGGELVGAMSLADAAKNDDLDMQLIPSTGFDFILVGLRGDRQAAFVESYIATGHSRPLVIADPVAATLARINSGRKSSDVYWPVMWHHSLFRYSARELNSRHLKRFNVPMDNESWSNWTAVKIVSEAVIRSQSTDAKSLLRYLESQPPFDGHKGASLTFDLKRRQLSHTLFVLKKERSHDRDAVEAAKVVFRYRMKPK